MSYIGTEANQDIVVNSHEYTATDGQTEFNVSYDDYVEVYLNGTRLSETEYTATNGMSVVLAQGATAGDIVRVNGYESFKYNNSVMINGDQTVDGIKTFVKPPVIPNAVNPDEALAKGQFVGGLGLTSEVWVDETANRTAGTTYTNTYGKPITVTITNTYNVDNTTALSVDGVIITSINGGGNSQCSGSITVFENSTYSVSGSIDKWFELK